MKKRIIYSLIFSALSFIIVISMLHTTVTSYYAKNDDIASTLTADNVFYGNNCDFADDGTVTVYGQDASIEIRNEEVCTKTVNVKLAENAKKNIKAQLYFSADGEYTEKNSVYGFCTKGNKDICFTLPEIDNYILFRLDIDVDYRFGALEFHTDEPILETKSTFGLTFEIIVSLLLSVAVFLLLFFTDRKFNYFCKLNRLLRSKLKAILITAGLFAADCILGFIVSKFIFKFDTFENTVFVTGVIAVITLLTFGFKFMKERFEVILFGLILIFGTVMILAVPFGHACWDTDSHYPLSLQASTFSQNYLTEADYYVSTVFKGENAIQNKEFIETANALNGITSSINDSPFSPAHLPSGIFLAVARFFGASFYVKFVIGKFANLLIYAICFYFGAKMLKSGKIILSLFALFPTNLFLASSYSYDYFVIAFIALGICAFSNELQNPARPINVKNALKITLPIAIGCIPKLIYMPLLALPYFLRKDKNRFGNKKAYYTVCTTTIIVFCILFAIRSLISLKGGGDMRGGSDISTVRQVTYILEQPFEFIKTYFRFIINYYAPKNSPEYIVNFAYLGYGKGGIAIFTMLLLAVFTNKNKYDTYTNGWYGVLLKVISVALFVGISSLIAVAFYIDFTPVGADYISGCQWRYLTPLIISPALVLGNGKHTAFLGKINGCIYNYVFTVPTCIFVLLSVYSTMLFI